MPQQKIASNELEFSAGIFPITGAISVSAGSNTAPAITTAGDTNTGMFFPAADTIAFTEGGVESMRIDSAGQMGIGVIPSAWSGVGSALQVGVSAAIIGNGASSSSFISNAYFDGSTYRYIGTGTASRLAMTSGTYVFTSVGSGTAGNALSFTELMRIGSDGNVGIGNNGPSSFDLFANRLVVGNGSGSQGITIFGGTGGASNLSFADGTAGSAAYQGFISYSHVSDTMGFWVNYAGNVSPRMLIANTGAVGIATTTPAVSLDINSTNAIRIPIGTTAQRPGSPTAGMIRHNSDTDEPEWYDDQNTTWRAFAEKSYNGYSVDYLIVAGGGAPGGSWSTGGGSGGGVVEGTVLVNSATSYRVIIGAGAAPSLTESVTWGVNGGNSSFQDLIAVGGGGGGGWSLSGMRGGSGGGASSAGGSLVAGYPVYRQGFAGGTGTNNGTTYSGGGGGGAGGTGENAPSVSTSGRGGPGHWSTMTGSGTWYAAGGAGGSNINSFSAGGQGSTNPGGSGGANTGTGGGGNSGPSGTTGKGSGGSGIVVIRYAGSQRGTGGTVNTISIEGTTYTVHVFTTSGTYTA